MMIETKIKIFLNEILLKLINKKEMKLIKNINEWY